MTPAAIREARDKLGLSQTQLARALGVSVRSVKHWEAGTRQADATAARLIAAYAEGYRPQDWPKGDE